jgi:amino acid adenylation domain-containing protein
VLGKAINLLKDEGLVFLGDIMDQGRKEALLDSLINFKRQNSDKGYKTKTDWSNELFISYSFFEDLQHDLPQITGVHRTEKIGTDGNELTDFRFDVVLTINKKIPTKPNRPRKKHQLGEADWKNYPTQAVAKKIPSTSLAYIAFTSGTTGFPKGVMVEHKSVLRLVLNTNYVTVLPEDRLMHAAPLSFDASTFEIWAALLNGGVVHTIKKDTLLNFSALEEVLNRSHIQIAWLTSPLFNTLIDFAPQLLQHFRTLLVGGDALSPAHIRKAQEHFPNLKIINGYGPTENTTFSTTFPITKESLLEYPTIPIGRPIANSSCYIFKETNNQHLSPIGIFGELYVAGDGLARGYLNDVLLTNSKFIKHPLLKDERLYRTGDRAKWLPDGNIEFGGRLDEQIKIRGFRIEVKEIEHQLTLQNGVKGAVVVVHENENKEKVLAAYLSTDSEINLDEVKSSLAHFLPDYMIPDFFIVLDSIPLNENGKVDRNALPPVMAARTGQDNTLPRNATEEKLHAIWKRVLGLPSMGVNDNFFQLGGHSLRATQVISLVLEKMSVKISIREIFLHPTIAQLSKVVLSKERVNLVHIERVATQPHYEVSYEQRRLWVLSQFERDQIVYNMPGVYKLTHTNRTIFEQVLQLLIERHESLRTIFVSVEGEPRQKILEWNKDVFALTFHDLRGMVQVQEVVDRMAQEEALKPFALDKGPLFRTTLLQTSEDEYVFLYTLHHIICDGWSVGVIVKEISLLYEVFMAGQQNPLPPLSIQYRDYAAWQRQQLTGHELENHRGYWLQKLQAPLPILNLPTDFARPKVKSFEGKGMAFELDETLSVKTEQLCQTHDATLFMTFLAVVQLVLSKYSKQTDLIIGAPVSGRVHKDLEPLIGFFVNMIVLRQTVDEEITFSEFLKHSKRNVLEAYDHQVHPYDKLIGDLGLQRDISRNPLFDVVVTADVNDLLINGIEVPEKSKVQVEDVALEFNIGSKFDLMLRMIRLENKRIKIDIHFNSGLFKERSILLLKDWIIRTLEAITTDANLRIADLPLNWNIEPTTPKVTAEFNF